jgi:hypothetical protein
MEKTGLTHVLPGNDLLVTIWYEGLILGDTPRPEETGGDSATRFAFLLPIAI